MKTTEEDFELTSKTKKKTLRSTPWSPKVLKLVRSLVLKESDDFVVPGEIARVLHIQLHEAGSCLNLLSKEGVVSARMSISPIDSSGDPVTIRFGSHSWNELLWDGKKWVYYEKTTIRSRKTGKVRFGSEKIKITPCKWWDGTGFYILKNSAAFRLACELEGLPTNPWACKHCKTQITH